MTTLKTYRVTTSCLTAFESFIEAEDEEQANELAFTQDDLDWEETGDPHWELESVELYEDESPKSNS